ncbi:hypothetical protein AGABI2DRAFT_193799 [Agaricus bisporus var. bisporus H97]|uniref:hypothetical protein n=1 Tax=Agaricus bisporus var. bisporus (strain H97 / ATCC MYA-4626 / FGSC 10389) TaxID=936046 RepID=UPI00029F4ED8|nr:hypothetical protein AGABI2DRAFT_193799 [Agaricus bisporus var. bisporus H97]EKV45875.1 hypothetical protein AGABI2DRAFT_193799 [Agaricus bisporus var. bisporus H97]
MASNLAHSLPPFAQAFSTHSLSSISTANNALPPIHARIAPDDLRVDLRNDDDSAPHSRKRSHQDISLSPGSSERASPHIKQEQDQCSPPPADRPDVSPPSPASSSSPLKKRRVTISGAPHPLDTDLRPVADQTNSTPISPVVMGLAINRDNMEQVRSMLTVKQKQKALIEQRRGTGLTSTSEERITAPPKSAVPPRSARRSPSTRRGLPQTGTTRPASPNPMLAPTHPPAPVPSQTLPFPPISFARRRADLFGGKKKPADILISPRETQSPDSLQPAIQSAPPIPHAGQGSYQSARLGMMAIPRLPPAMSATDNVRKVASNVPPTPTRLARSRPAAAATPMISSARRSPPASSVPIAATLVPPTPASLHHPGYSGDRNAFLAPFELFYDALNDSKQLKSWLGEQLQRSNALVQSLTSQQEKLNETIEAAVEKRVNGMRAEMVVLRRRVEDLEYALRDASPDRRPGFAGSVKGKQPIRNGASFGPPESSTFPPSHEPPRHRSDAGRRPSPSWPQEWEVRGVPPPPPHSGDSDRHISPPYDSRRLATVSASRLDPPRPRDLESSSHHPRANVPSPPQAYREHPQSQNYAPVRDSHPRARDRPGLSRQHSHSEGNSSPIPVPSSNSPRSTHQQPPRRVTSPRISSVMSPPEVPGSETG